MENCAECGTPFESLGRGRPQKFCSRKCFLKNYYRHPDDDGTENRERKCLVCTAPFAQKKRNQKYCSSTCYRRAWTLDPAKNNARTKKWRGENLELARGRDTGYSSKYRAKILSSHPWNYLLQSARLRAKQKGWEFTLTPEWAAARWTNRCEITGLPFRASGKRGPHPFSASIDRCDSSKGYTPDNTRFILWGCNALKGVGTDSDMLAIASAIVLSTDRMGL